MENSLSRQILLSILGLAILVVAVVGVSYAIFSTTLSGSKINTLSSGTINMSYVEVSNGISIINAMPMSDTDGKALTDCIGPDGEIIKTRPRGFYMRRAYTAQLVKNNLQQSTK